MAEHEGVARRVTSVDVAREAGLSRTTVSYVLNRDPRQTIPDVTRQRVLDAAARLGYKPYGPARLLRGAKSSVVLMFTPGLERAADFVSTSIITRLGIALAEHGLHLIWQLGDVDDSGPSADLAPVVVLSSAAEGDEVYEGLRDHFAVPVLSAYPGLDAFIAAGATAQVEHLFERGRRALAYVLPDREDLAAVAEVRWNAVVAASTRLGIAPPARLKLSSDRPTAEAQLRDFLARNPAVDGVCAFNDEVAFAVLAAAADAGFGVPERLAVVGIDNHPFGALAIPALSTVQSDVTDFVAAFAANIARITRGEAPAAVTMPDRAQPVRRASS